MNDPEIFVLCNLTQGIEHSDGFLRLFRQNQSFLDLAEKDGRENKTDHRKYGINYSVGPDVVKPPCKACNKRNDQSRNGGRQRINDLRNAHYVGTFLCIGGDDLLEIGIAFVEEAKENIQQHIHEPNDHAFGYVFHPFIRQPHHNGGNKNDRKSRNSYERQKFTALEFVIVIIPAAENAEGNADNIGNNHHNIQIHRFDPQAGTEHQVRRIKTDRGSKKSHPIHTEARTTQAYNFFVGDIIALCGFRPVFLCGKNQIFGFGNQSCFFFFHNSAPLKQYTHGGKHYL